MDNYFTQLNSINVNDKAETKNGLSYLSWAWAWGEVKKLYPDANYIIYERDTEFGPVNYFTDGRTCWVKTGVIVNGIEHIEELPVMNYRNQSLVLDVVTSFDVNKTIQRSLTKALARHGLGLYIYAGEDLPEEEKAEKASRGAPTATKAAGADNSSTDGKKPLKTLISEIGSIAKNIMAKNGNLDAYYDVIEDVTEDRKFKCNSATEAQYDTILKIHDRLIKAGYSA